MITTIERLINIGFTHCGTFECDGNKLKTILHSTKDEPRVLYAFALNNEVKYLGKSIKGIKKRLALYCTPGPTQTTNIRINKLIRTHLQAGGIVNIFAYYCDQNLNKGEFRINTAAGLEDSIIETLHPEWNINKPTIESAPPAPKQVHRRKPISDAPYELSTKLAGRPHFTVRIGKAYWLNGFFNVGVDFERYFGKHNSTIKIFLGSESSALSGYVNRTANHNGTPRIMGGVAMRNWIRSNSKLGGTFEVTVLHGGDIRLSVQNMGFTGEGF